MDIPTTLKNIGAGASENRATIALTFLSVALTAAFLYLFYVRPAASLGPEQPIPFSHRVHAGDKAIACQFCHSYVGRSAFPGIPPVEKCLYCHNYIIAGHPEIQKEHQYFNTNTPTPWAKVTYLPEHVFFKHIRHIKKDVACAECHGAVERADRLDRRVFLMGFCIDCHQRRQAPIGCWLSCHN